MKCKNLGMALAILMARDMQASELRYNMQEYEDVFLDEEDYTLFALGVSTTQTRMRQYTEAAVVTLAYLDILKEMNRDPYHLLSLSSMNDLQTLAALSTSLLQALNIENSHYIFIGNFYHLSTNFEAKKAHYRQQFDRCHFDFKKLEASLYLIEDAMEPLERVYRHGLFLDMQEIHRSWRKIARAAFPSRSFCNSCTML